MGQDEGFSDTYLVENPIVQLKLFGDSTQQVSNSKTKKHYHETLGKAIWDHDDKSEQPLYSHIHGKVCPGCQLVTI